MVTWICESRYMDLLKLLHGFLLVPTFDLLNWLHFTKFFYVLLAICQKKLKFHPDFNASLN